MGNAFELTGRERPLTLADWDNTIKTRRIFSYASGTITAPRGEFKRIRHKLTRLLAYLPRDYQKLLINRFTKEYNKNGYLKAFRDIEKITAPIQPIFDKCIFDNLAYLLDDNLRRQQADYFAANLYQLHETFAGQLQRTALDYPQKIRLMYEFLCDNIKRQRLPLKYNPKTATTEQAESGILRLLDGKTWERHYTAHARHTNEHLAIALGFVRKKVSPYCSRLALGDYRAQMHANKIYLAMMDVINVETEHVQRLDEIAALSSANPEKRRIELMVRIHGMEELAKTAGKEALFLTLTAPSRYHKQSKKYAGYTPKETNGYLCQTWARARAALARAQIDYEGIRVCEPHADATPHWHALVFIAPEHKNELLGIIERYFTAEDSEELRAGYKRNQLLVAKKVRVKPWATWCEPRFAAVVIDPSKGSATGYIAKYIAKNINAKNIENLKDADGRTKMDESAERVSAWASLWRLRQFQFFGSVSISVWRECRRIKNPLKIPALELVRQAADSGNWRAFTGLMRQTSITLSYDIKPERNKFNEQIKKISGIAFCSVKNGVDVVPTRLESFVLQRREATSWSPVNNCTPSENQLIDRYSLSDKDKKKLVKLGMDSENIAYLLAGRVAYAGIQQFKITNGALVTH